MKKTKKIGLSDRSQKSLIKKRRDNRFFDQKSKSPNHEGFSSLQVQIEGYKFPVFTTDVSPSDKAEWRASSSALTCKCTTKGINIRVSLTKT